MKPDTIDEYIASFGTDVRAVLEHVRAAVRKAAPEATETISYGIPAFRQNGVLVYFGAFRKHIGFYPPIRDDARLKAAAARYEGPKGNLQFPLDQPIPYRLIERITKLRVSQNTKRHGGARAAASRPRVRT